VRQSATSPPPYLAIGFIPPAAQKKNALISAKLLPYIANINYNSI
jgi:hypothetical protein